MSLTSDEFLERVSEHLDPDELVDVLKLSTKRLVYLIADHILDNRELIDNYLNYEENDLDDERYDV